MTALDVKQAKQALSWRLAQWGVTTDVDGKAASFIDDLVFKGWQMAPERESRPRPAKPDDECRLHRGEHADACRGCAADKLAGDNEARTPPRPHQAAEPTAGYRAARAAVDQPDMTEET